MPDMGYYAERGSWLAERLEATLDERLRLSPSEWAEQKRYLPPQNTPQPGPYSFDATPYWKEVIDCFDPDHPARFVAIQKGAQVGATTAVLENIIGYQIDYVRTAPMIFATADRELTKLRIDEYITPMLQHSGLYHLIQSNDEGNKRKQGQTDDKISFVGGGFLVPIGAQSPTKMRSLPVPILLRDEISGWPLSVGRDADPLKLTETRTNSFESTRKILDLSTPLLAGTDAISKRFAMGNQCYYEVPCKHCGEYQVLKFRHIDGDGVISGLIWESESDGSVTPGSTRYVCRFCSGEMINEDKMVFMAEGRWTPTARPTQPNFYSYHLSALYAPHFARTWEAIAQSWVEAWDDDKGVPKDGEALQVFYNNDLGMPYEKKTDRLKEHQVSPHRRHCYRLGELPGDHPEKFAGGPIQIITMAVDVQKAYLSVCVTAWAPSGDRQGYSAYCLDYFNIQGNCEDPTDQSWETLSKIIENRTYTGGGKEYPISLTLVDASAWSETVYTFCSQYERGVFPLRGRDKPTKAARFCEFDIKVNATGTRYASVVVDVYKDRWSSALKREWDGLGHLPRNSWSCPADLPDKALRELTVEYKREKRDPANNKLLGTYWYRPSGSRNELWDLLVYNTAALEMSAVEVCQENLGLDSLIWADFWGACEEGLFWFVAP